MNDQPINENKIASYTKDMYANLVPFGSSDVYEAIKTAIEVGEDGDWVAEQITDYCDNIGDHDLGTIDCVAVVYDSILQEARNELIEVIDFDIQNDANFNTYANYMCTSYDTSDDDVKEVQRLLEEKEVAIDGLSQKTQWFLKQTEVL